jgi:Zn-finger protein
MSKIKEFLRDLFSPFYCEKGKHRLVFSQGMKMWRCNDCWNYFDNTVTSKIELNGGGDE